MATVKDIYNFIDSIAPFNTQEEWDNSGLLVGDENTKVTKILFALDITTDVINQAVACGANLIVSHHPLIFKPMANLMFDSLVYKVVENKINVISAHTNLDKAFNGVNDVLCRKIGFNDFVKTDGDFLNIAEYDKSISLTDFVTNIKTSLSAVVRYNTISEKQVKKIGICGGSGCDFIKLAKELGCDAFLTGDASHHDFVDATEMGIALVAVGHFESENLVMEPLKNSIKEKLEVPCVMALQTSPYLMK